jgi:hypothetical protein
MAVKKRLGQMLIEAGVIDQAQLQAALGHQRKWGGRLGHSLVEMKLTTEPRIVEALAAKFGYDVVRPGALDAGPLLENALGLIPREFAIRNNVIAYEADSGSISIATADPANISVLDEVQFRTGRRVKVTLAGEQEIGEALRRFFGVDERIEGIALDLEDDGPGEAIATDSFLGGSTAELEQFFTSDPIPPAPAAPPQSPQPAPARQARPDAVARPAPARPAPSAAPSAKAPSPAPSASPSSQAPSPAPAPVSPQQPRSTPSRRAAVPALPLPSELIPEVSASYVLDGTPTPTPLPVHLEAREELRPRPAPAAAPASAPPPEAESDVEEEPLLMTELVPDEPTPPASPSVPAEPSDDGGLSDEDMAVLASLDHLVQGAAPSQALVVKPTQMLAAVIRLLIRKKIISELELIEELHQK